MPQSNNLCAEMDRIRAKDSFLDKIKEIQDQMNKLPAPAHERHCPYCEPWRCPHCGRPFTYPQPGVWM